MTGQQSTYFNPRPREGSDVGNMEIMTFGLKISIHAPVKGATTAKVKAPKGFSYFNPRPREGSDSYPTIDICFFVYFNPRPREGSDLSNSRTFSGRLHFNPRPREGSDSMK